MVKAFGYCILVTYMLIWICRDTGCLVCVFYFHHRLRTYTEVCMEGNPAFCYDERKEKQAQVKKGGKQHGIFRKIINPA